MAISLTPTPSTEAKSTQTTISVAVAGASATTNYLLVVGANPVVALVGPSGVWDHFGATNGEVHPFTSDGSGNATVVCGAQAGPMTLTLNCYLAPVIGSVLATATLTTISAA